LSQFLIPPGRGLDIDDLAELRRAVSALERRSFAAQMSALAGRQLSFAGVAIPPHMREVATKAARAGLEAALRVAIKSLRQTPGGVSTGAKAERLHKGLAMAAGAVGGALGLVGLPLELPISTTILLRAIADIARDEGEDLQRPEAAIACLEVFALGGHGDEDGVLEGGYLALRGLFAKSVSDAARYAAAYGVSAEAAPVFAALVTKIAARFGVAVSQKTAAQAMPALGALSGAAINLAFAEHFQALARGHFVVRRLERAYGAEIVQEEYARILQSEGYSSAA
jgi:hypothetical protein